MYKIKLKSDRYVQQYKACLVILGNTQVEGQDFTEIFAPVTKLITVQTLLAVVVARKWEIHQIDVHNTFLHGGSYKRGLYKVPPGFLVFHINHVFLLKKYLYGLKHAPQCWFSKRTQAIWFYTVT